MRRGALIWTVVAVAIAVAVTTGSAAPAAADTGPAPVAATSDTVVATAFYDLRRRVLPLATQTPWVTALRGEQVLALGADSGLTGSPLLGGTTTAYPVFTFDAAASTAQALGTVDLGPLAGPQSWVRVLDYQYVPQLQVAGDARAHALVSFATYSAQTGCRRLIVTDVAIDLTGAGRNALGKTWYTLPCIVPYTPNEGDWMYGPGLHQSGGRVALVPKAQWAKPTQPEIYLTTGDFAMLVNLGDQIPASTRRLLTDVLRISSTGRVSVVATGIRNGQGLTTATLDGKSALVGTTHGPRGGDELMNIKPGDDYGWPRESYGTVYSYTPLAVQSRPQTEGKLPTATKPAFSWVPSIGPAAVVQVAAGGAFGTWWGAVAGRPTGDLLVSGMAAQQVFRVRWDAGAVRYVEAMSTGARIRSLTQTASGVIVAGVDTAGPDAGAIMVLTPARAWDSTTASMR